MTLDDDIIADLPPSAKLVVKVLEYNGGLTQKRIVERSRLSQRTVRDALSRLEDAGIVEKEIYIPDARQNLYRLTVGDGEDAESTAVEAADATVE
jgi:DNA-binding MarR family transcriptional regulator